MASCVALVIVTWVRGSRLLVRQTRKNEADLDWLLRKLEAKPPHRVPGTAVFFTGDPNAAPTALMHNLKHNRVLHERNIILSIKTEDTPRVPRYERVTVDRVSDSFIRVVARYGFMETPSVPKIFDQCRRKDLNVDISATSFFLSRRNLKVTPKSEMPGWQDRLFVALARSAQDATTYFQIPTTAWSRSAPRSRFRRERLARLTAAPDMPNARRARVLSPGKIQQWRTRRTGFRRGLRATCASAPTSAPLLRASPAAGCWGATTTLRARRPISRRHSAA